MGPGPAAVKYVTSTCSHVSMVNDSNKDRPVLTSVNSARLLASWTIDRQSASLRSRVAALPRMNTELFARVKATFIRRTSEKQWCCQ